jgi:hypothetical protein
LDAFLAESAAERPSFLARCIGNVPDFDGPLPSDIHALDHLLGLAAARDDPNIGAELGRCVGVLLRRWERDHGEQPNPAADHLLGEILSIGEMVPVPQDTATYLYKVFTDNSFDRQDDVGRNLRQRALYILAESPPTFAVSNARLIEFFIGEMRRAPFAVAGFLGVLRLDVDMAIDCFPLLQSTLGNADPPISPAFALRDLFDVLERQAESNQPGSTLVDRANRLAAVASGRRIPAYPHAITGNRGLARQLLMTLETHVRAPTDYPLAWAALTTAAIRPPKHAQPGERRVRGRGLLGGRTPDEQRRLERTAKSVVKHPPLAGMRAA